MKFLHQGYGGADFVGVLLIRADRPMEQYRMNNEPGEARPEGDALIKKQ